jgi:hypothetical protein
MYTGHPGNLLITTVTSGRIDTGLAASAPRLLNLPEVCGVGQQPQKVFMILFTMLCWVVPPLQAHTKQLTMCPSLGSPKLRAACRHPPAAECNLGCRRWQALGM